MAIKKSIVMTPAGTMQQVSSSDDANDDVDAVSTSNVTSLSGLSTTVDTVPLDTDGMRVLLTAQTTTSENGIWIVHSTSWTRAPDLKDGDGAQGAFQVSTGGSTYAATGWICTTKSPNDIVGTNGLTFVQISASAVAAPHHASHEYGGSDAVTLAQSQVTNLTTDLAAKLAASEKGAASGVATLDGSSKLTSSQLPAIAESDVTGLTSDLASKIASSEKGAASGVATLDGSSKLTSSQLPAIAESAVTNLTTDLAAKIASSEKGANSGVATLDSSGKLTGSQVPAIAITDTFVVASQSAMLALTAQTGDVAVRTDLSKCYILKGTDPTTLSEWQELLTPTSPPASHHTSHESGGSDQVTLAQSQITGLKVRKDVTYQVTTHATDMELTNWGTISKPSGITTVGKVIIGSASADADANAIFGAGVFISWKLVSGDIYVKFVSGLELSTAYTFVLEVVDA